MLQSMWWNVMKWIEILDLSGANLSYAKLIETKIKLAILNRVILEGAIIRNKKFSNSSFDYANLKGAVIIFSDLWGAAFQMANLEGADLTRTNFWFLCVCWKINIFYRTCNLWMARYVHRYRTSRNDNCFSFLYIMYNYFGIKRSWKNKYNLIYFNWDF